MSRTRAATGQIFPIKAGDSSRVRCDGPAGGHTILFDDAKLTVLIKRDVPARAPHLDGERVFSNVHVSRKVRIRSKGGTRVERDVRERHRRHPQHQRKRH